MRQVPRGSSKFKGSKVQSDLERSGVAREKFVKVSVLSSSIFRQIRLTRRSIQSEADSGLPNQQIRVAFVVNLTFLYHRPRDTHNEWCVK